MIRPPTGPDRAKHRRRARLPGRSAYRPPHPGASATAPVVVDADPERQLPWPGSTELLCPFSVERAHLDADPSYGGRRASVLRPPRTRSVNP